MESHQDPIFRKYNFVLPYQKPKQTSKTEIPWVENLFTKLKKPLSKFQKKKKNQKYISTWEQEISQIKNYPPTIKSHFQNSSHKKIELQI